MYEMRYSTYVLHSIVRWVNTGDSLALHWVHSHRVDAPLRRSSSSKILKSLEEDPQAQAQAHLGVRLCRSAAALSNGWSAITVTTA